MGGCLIDNRVKWQLSTYVCVYNIQVFTQTGLQELFVPNTYIYIFATYKKSL